MGLAVLKSTEGHSVALWPGVTLDGIDVLPLVIPFDRKCGAEWHCVRQFEMPTDTKFNIKWPSENRFKKSMPDFTIFDVCLA